MVEALDAATAAAGVVDATQIEILEAAVSEGRDVTFEEYSVAANSAVECIQSSGLVIEVGVHPVPADGGTLLTLWISAEGIDDVVSAVAQECMTKFVTYVESAYQGRASVQEWRDEVSARYYDAMFACLESRDVRVESAMSMEELVQAEVDTFPNYPPDARCVASTGYEASITGAGD